MQSYKEPVNMSFAIAKEIVQKEMVNARKFNRKMELRLMGGEPFMNFGLIKELCEWIWSEYSSEDINVSIRTNGTLMSEDKNNGYQNTTLYYHVVQALMVYKRLIKSIEE